MTVTTSLSFTSWLALAGALLLLLSVGSSYLRRMPISSSSVYLALGVLLGPHALGWVELRVGGGGAWFERLTELAVVVALFVSGLKLRLAPRHEAWIAVYRLAGPGMLACIAAVALAAHFLLKMSWPSALLLGAILAPTDPVLASAVSVNDAADRDRVKYALSGEAGLNDGTAFPFVALALSWQAYDSTSVPLWLLRWAVLDLFWAVGAALALGYLMGLGFGRWSIAQRSRLQDVEAPSDFAALALIALAYTGAHLLHAWTFLAVFAAGVGLRRAEVGIVAASPHPDHVERNVSHPPAEHLVPARVAAEQLDAPAVAAGVTVAETISFGGTLERILEVVLVTLVGIAVSSYWDARALIVSLVLFVVARPAATYLLLAGTSVGKLQRLLIGWFGIRGIGSLYYLAYALNHSHSTALQDNAQLAGLTLSVVSLSILLHGSSSTPLLNLYERRRRAAPQSARAT